MRGTDFCKRAFDVVVASALFLVTLPIMAVAAIIIAFELRANPLFMLERVGLDGKPFRFLKLRTLPKDTPRYTSKYSIDERHLPPFCAALRRTHIDELPQLLLVVMGRMSLVGPRPEMSYLHRQLDPAFAIERTSVRPGCTGLWQIGHRSISMIGEHPEFDSFYVRNRSVRLDAWILVHTLTAVAPFTYHPPISLRDVPAWARPATVTQLVLPRDDVEPAEEQSRRVLQAAEA